MWHQLSRAAAILAFGLICLWFQSAALALPLLWVTAAQSQADPASVVFHGGDGAVEFSSASMHLGNAMNDVYKTFEEQRVDYPGKVPVIACTGSEPKKDKYGTNYRPVLELVKWVDRPADLPDVAPVDESEVWRGNSKPPPPVTAPEPAKAAPSQRDAPPQESGDPGPTADPMAESEF